MTHKVRGLKALALVSFAALALGAAGCKQGPGDRCQVNSDCQDTLACVIPVGISAAVGGTCVGAAALDGGQPDLTSAADGPATPPDLASTIDQASPSDLAPAPTNDLGSGDLAAPADLSSSPSDGGRDAAPSLDARSGG